jgi:hypothetical protein
MTVRAQFFAHDLANGVEKLLVDRSDSDPIITQDENFKNWFKPRPSGISRQGIRRGLSTAVTIPLRLRKPSRAQSRKPLCEKSRAARAKSSSVLASIESGRSDHHGDEKAG